MNTNIKLNVEARLRRELQNAGAQPKGETGTVRWNVTPEPTLGQLLKMDDTALAACWRAWHNEGFHCCRTMGALADGTQRCFGIADRIMSFAGARLIGRQTTR